MPENPVLLYPREAAKLMRRNRARFLADYVEKGLIRVVIESDGRMMIPYSELQRYCSEFLYEKEQPKPPAGLVAP